MTTKDLLTRDRAFQSYVSHECFRNRRQQSNHLLSVLRLICVVAVLRSIQPRTYVGRERTTSFVERTHSHQHTTYIRVYDDWVSCFVFRDCTSWRTALDTVTSISNSVLVRVLGNAQPLDTHTQTLIVHHGEHARQTFVFFAYEPAFCTVVVHYTGRRTFDTHLVLDRTTRSCIALTQRTVFVHQEFRYQEQRNTLRASWCIRQFRQYQVDDVLCHVMLAPSDKDLGASNIVRTVSVWLSFGTDDTQVSTRVRFGQVHRARPYARVHVRQVLFFQFL